MVRCQPTTVRYNVTKIKLSGRNYKALRRQVFIDVPSDTIQESVM